MSIPDKFRTATVFGRLDSLQLENPDVQEQILMLDKHQILEGTFFAEQFESYMAESPAFSSQFSKVSVQTALGKTKKGQFIALVLVEGRSSGLGRYLLALRQVMPVFLVSYDPSEREFMACDLCFSGGPEGVTQNWAAAGSRP